jgi:hypothetical protein
MKVVKELNNISDKLKATIPSFSNGETKNFRMLNGKKNDEPDLAERSKNPVLFPRTQIPTKDRIYDPYGGKDGKGDYVDILVADGWNGDVPTRPTFFLPGESDFRFEGKFALTGGSVRDMELFEYFWLCNYREGNPNRDKSITPLFEYIDIKAESQENAAPADLMFEALGLAIGLKDDIAKANTIAASLNWTLQTDDEILINSLKVYAQKEPAHFIKIANTDKKVLENKSFVKEALDAGVLTFETTTGKLSNKNSLLNTFDMKQGFEPLDEIAAWLSSAANGAEITKSVKKQMKKEVV